MRCLVLVLVLSGCATKVQRDGDYMTTFCVGMCAITTSKGETIHKSGTDD